MVNVQQGVTSVTISAYTRDYRATVTVDGAPRGSDYYGTRVSLVQGEDKAIPVVVTAEDGVTTKTYTVTVVQVPVTTEDEEPAGEDSGNQGVGGL